MPRRSSHGRSGLGQRDVLVGKAADSLLTALRLNNVSRQYAVSPDGQRFLMVVPTHDIDSELFRVLLNWRPAAGK